jgi:hypothetical protein
MSNIQAQIDALAGSIQVLDNTVSNITGNTLSNYNQLSRIVAQQGNIYNTIYYGTGNLTTGNLTVTNNYNILGNLNVDSNTFLVDSINNRVGILNTNPQYTLDVNGSGNISTSLNVGALTSTQSAVITTSSSSSTYGLVSEATSASGQRTHIGFRVPTIGELGNIYTASSSTFGIYGLNEVYLNTPRVYTNGNLITSGNANITGNLGVTGNIIGTSNIILLNGNIGIGTSNPLQKLDISGNANISGNLFVRNNMAINSTSAGANLDIVGNARISGNLNVDSGTMWVDATNNRIGVLNTNPQQALDIKGSANISVDTFVRNNLAVGSTSASANLDITGNARISGNLNVDNGALWVDATNNRVGINNTNPQDALDVVGDANIVGALTTTKAIEINTTGSGSTTLWQASNSAPYIARNVTYSNQGLQTVCFSDGTGTNDYFDFRFIPNSLSANRAATMRVTHLDPSYTTNNGAIDIATGVFSISASQSTYDTTSYNGLGTSGTYRPKFGFQGATKSWNFGTATDSAIMALACTTDSASNFMVKSGSGIQVTNSSNYSLVDRTFTEALRVNGNSLFNGNLNLNTGNIIVTNGNIGVKKVNPAFEIDVTGSINFTGSLYQNGSPFSGTTQWTTSGTTIYYNTGNVGLGTATPLARLDVGGNARVTGNLNVDDGTLWVDATNNRVGVNNTNPQKAFDVKGGANVSTNLYVGTSIVVNATNNTAVFDVQGNAVVNGNLNVDNGTMWVDSTNSRVGILNTNPKFPLDIKGIANVSANIFCAGISTHSTQSPLKILSGNITTNASGYYNFAWTQFINTPYLVLTAIDNQVNMRVAFIRTITNTSANIRVVDTANGGVSVIVNYIAMGY